jgi:hypothetical protein
MALVGQVLNFPASIGKPQSRHRNQPARLRSFVSASSVPIPAVTKVRTSHAQALLGKKKLTFSSLIGLL